MSFDPDTAACAALTQRGDPDRFAATMALPVPARAKLLPLWAFNIEVARAPWVTQEPMIAEMRLQWWRDALEEIAQAGVVRRHEVVTPLSVLLTPDMVPVLDRLIDARRRDLDTTPFEDEAALKAYFDATTGGLLWTAAQLLGAPSADEAPLRQVARAVATANWLVAVPELEARGKRPMPDGTPQTVARLARSALSLLRAQKGLSRPARAALLSGFMARPTLKQASRRPGDVAKNRLHFAPLHRSGRLISAWVNGRI